MVDIAHRGDPAAWAAAPFSQNFPGREIHYRSQWYAQRNDDAMLFALGIHGQWLFVDHHQNIVMAKFSSQDEPLDFQKMSLTMSVFDSLRNALRY
jgi:CubicO group peptidase (beta-lactamase class C family)